MSAPAAARPPSPLSFPAYRWFWLARFASVMATIGMVVVIGWQVYDVARSVHGMTPRAAAVQLGLLGLVQFIPLALLTPVAGWVADRFERRTVARLANGLDAMIALILGVAAANDALSLPLLFAMGAGHGAARAFTGPAISAIGPNIVPPAVLPRAIAMSSIAWQSASIIGPALAGFLLAVGPDWPYWTSAALMGFAIVALSMVHRVAPPPVDKAVHPLRQMIDGLRYTWADRFLLGTITLDLFAVLLGGAIALLPVYARDILMVGPVGLGWLRAAPAVGAALVALWLAFRPVERNVGERMLWAVAGFGVATIVFGLSRNLALSLVALFVLGATDMFSVFVRSSLVQLNTPDAMRGRVSAVSGLAISASNELGELRAGLSAAVWGPVGAVVIGGVTAIGITALWARLFPELRAARTFAPMAARGPDPHAVARPTARPQVSGQPPSQGTD